ncbi:uncharacterized protein M421DRAFT_51919 [Didymella exigua CBS 183.55]|uniref:Uncharacterized protein n=1 Tax=Didymella exigua CBS 183.55 TaxID=1150837 RepID=A0A6A5S0V1_9PLEO|nr:uncharacterized protein M421DRAFT_51919 [Didymella exigua CBS 183.55]KAF1933752.1 hypothetical protein M421DRAFT_51919 [Didymella exigua CBS 183.55]
MPLCTLHLLSLHRTPDPIPPFLAALRATHLAPLVVARVIRWIILPSHLSTAALLAHNIKWDLLLILPGTDALPRDMAALVAHSWSVTAGVPSRLTSDFAARNDKLLHPDPASVPPLRPAAPRVTGSSQNLQLSRELDAWIDSFLREEGDVGSGAVSMLNLLAFRTGMKDEYLKYGAAFAESVGSRHGGNAKIVGGVVRGDGDFPVQRGVQDGDGVQDRLEDGVQDWDEVALAQYPSIAHFRDMLASLEYQAVNTRHRLPSLRDTCILMTSEIAVERARDGGRARL